MELSLDRRMTTKRSVVALGMFDGVHRGHQVLLRKARREANIARAPLVCRTFAEHPSRLICPEKSAPMLTTFDERARLIEKLGVDMLCADPFTEKLRGMPAADFVGHLVRRWHPALVVVGYNYTFGRNAEGTPALMDQIGYELGFATIIVPEVRLDGETVSATHIRELLSAGKAEAAARLLGRPYERLAERGGDGRPRLANDGKLNPKPGRYRALLGDGARALPDAITLRDDQTVDSSCFETLSTDASLSIRFLCEIG